MSDDDRVDELERLVEALRRKVNTQADRIDELEGEVAELRELADPDPGHTEYQQLTREQKVHRLRKTLAENAARSGGKDAMKYKAVMTLFDNHPSAGHCYDLMERAADLDGFRYGEAGGGRGEKRIRVNLDAVNDEALLHAVNNGPQREAV